MFEISNKREGEKFVSYKFIEDTNNIFHPPTVNNPANANHRLRRRDWKGLTKEKTRAYYLYSMCLFPFPPHSELKRNHLCWDSVFLPGPYFPDPPLSPVYLQWKCHVATHPFTWIPVNWKEKTVMWPYSIHFPSFFFDRKFKSRRGEMNVIRTPRHGPLLLSPPNTTLFTVIAS